MKTVEELNNMTSEEFKNYLKYTKEGKEMVHQVAKNYAQIKNSKILTKEQSIKPI